MEERRIQQILDTGVLAGRILMESGSEMYRTEDTLERILCKGGLEHPEIFTTPTGIFVSARDINNTKMVQLTTSSVNLEKVAQVNALSRQFSQEEITLNELQQGLHQVDTGALDFPFWWKLISAFLISCTLMVLFTGQYDWTDFLPAGVVGLVGYLLFYYLNHVLQIQFISEFIASAGLALTALILQKIGLVGNLNNVIIGAAMPLVPGVALTNALRDLIAGHLLSGLARMCVGVLSAMAIGGGIAVILRFCS
ncbi:threonine/serine exporter family protein [Lactobacillus sp. DCY120]|uniref:Threonine/serine exporter family protein n=1 Tax=Bombilactobacillus apium TaxID=2675299 RepID=A0A850R8U4_9LACO|nr:threonine/serine exporter family protein [Bombilactobacillus apium]NVY97152.1 threonine/serine exporter family protein [Bombilactobacillus apium]